MSCDVSDGLAIVGGVVGGVVVGAAGVAVGAVAVAAGVAAVTAGVGLAAAGAAVVSVGMAAAGFAQGTVESAKAIGTLAKEEIAEYQKVKKEVEKIQLENKELAKQKIDQHLAGLDFSCIGISKEDMAFIHSKKEAEKLAWIDALSSVSYQLSGMTDLFYQLSKKGVTSDLESAFSLEKSQIIASIKAGDLEGVKAGLGRIATIRENSRELLKGLSKEDYERFEAVFFSLENEIGTAFAGPFQSEIADLLNKQRTEKVVSKDYQGNIASMRQSVLEIRLRLAGFAPYFKESSYADQLIDQILKVLADPSLSDASRYEEAFLNYQALSDVDKMLRYRYGDVLNLKGEYDSSYGKLNLMKQALGQEKAAYAFDPYHAEDSLASLQGEIDALAPLYEQHVKDDYVAKSLRECMQAIDCDFIEEKDVVYQNGKKEHVMFFHVEGGNVVRVAYSNGHVTYRVSGVKVPGYALDKGSLYSAEKTFCTKKIALDKALTQHGIAPTGERLVEPNDKYAYEIELSSKGQEYIAMQKRRTTGETMKRKKA
jgi:hypothetical protein